MICRRLLVALLTPILFLSAISHAQQLWSGILKPTSGAGACTTPSLAAPGACAIDWSSAGVPSGIPSGSWTQSGSTITATSGDRTSTIQSALNACGGTSSAGKYVLLGSGTFNITSLSIPSYCVLRGAGAANTILNLTGSSAGAINLGNGNAGTSLVSISSGATAGSKSLIVSSASGMAVGGYLVVSELNDPSYVTITGDNASACTWCDQYGGVRTRGQIVEITSISGTTIGITPALFTDYARTPAVTYFAASAKYAGAENFQVYANNTGYSLTNFYLSACAYCWVKGVHSNYADGDHVAVFWGFHDEIRDSYFHDAYSHTSGTTDGDIDLGEKTTLTLVENNIATRLHAGFMMEWGAAGNVVAYNYNFGNFDSTALNVNIASIDFHGAHPQFNLSEGNVGVTYYEDYIWGSEGNNTVFRNWMMGITQICSPTSGRGTVNCTGSNGHYTTQAPQPFYDATGSTDSNLVGNVAGSALLSSQTSEVKLAVSPNTRSYSTGYDYNYGYGSVSDSPGPCSSTGTCTSYISSLLHGAYANADGSITWSGALTHTLPASFYKPSMPSWWGNTIPWPPIGPDVTGGTGPGGHASLTASNPAQACYNATPKAADGSLQFDPNNCYGTSGGGGGSAPSAPTGLSAVVN
jgi:hypothetical protein